MYLHGHTSSAHEASCHHQPHGGREESRPLRNRIAQCVCKYASVVIAISQTFCVGGEKRKKKICDALTWPLRHFIEAKDSG